MSGKGVLPRDTGDRSDGQWRNTCLVSKMAEALGRWTSERETFFEKFGTLFKQRSTHFLLQAKTDVTLQDETGGGAQELLIANSTRPQINPSTVAAAASEGIPNVANGDASIDALYDEDALQTARRNKWSIAGAFDDDVDELKISSLLDGFPIGNERVCSSISSPPLGLVSRMRSDHRDERKCF
ncbi:hypothetical protein RP20_CCG016364 [Aedes albopictus]|nr:hypothetical protein RP20_CCG016364 [Aedes albopictus]